MPATTFAAPEARTSFVPLSRLLPGFLWPEDQFEGGSGVLDRVYATSWSAHPGCAELDLFAETEVALRMPGVDGLELMLGAPSDATGPGIAFGLQFVYGDDGHWSLTLTGLSVTLRWDGDLLVAMEEDGQGGFVETGAPYGVTLTGDLTLNDDWSVDLGACAMVELPPVQIGHTGIILRADDLAPYFGAGSPPPGLAELGFDEAFRGIHVREAQVFLPASWGGAATERYTAVPPPLESETDAGGQVVFDAGGGAIQQAPAEPVYVGPRITFADCAIGNGGFSGEVAFDADATTDLGEDPLPNLVGAVEDADRLEDDAAGVSGLSAELFGFGMALQRVELSFRRNALAASRIDGSLRVPFLDTWFDVEVALAGDGGFEVSLATESGVPLVRVTIEGVVEVVVDSIGIEDPGAGEPVGVVVNGTVRPLLDIGGDWPELGLRDLRIFADGQVALVGGWLKLPTQYAVDFFGFQLELASIGFGTGELVAGDGGDTGGAEVARVTAGVDKADDWRWIGLSGAIRLVDELAISGSVDGLKIAWRPLPGGGFEWDWSLSGIGVEAATDAFSFSGSVRFIDDPAGGRGFAGAVALSLATLGLGFEAEFVVGRTAEAPAGYAYWGVILGVDLPAGIPLGPTGIAFYGLKGLGSQNLTPDKTPAEVWYDGWYKRSDLSGRAGVTLAKFEPERGALGFGLGVTLGTAPDNGFTVNTKALALLLFPGPTILIAGKAAFLAPRSALDGSDEPPFESLLVIEGADGSVLLNIAAHYPLIDERVLSIGGDAEAYFSAADPADWHLYIGRRPLEERLSVKALSLFEALGYLVIDQTGLATGFRIGFGESWRFGRLSLTFDVHISGDGVLSFDPVSVAGRAELAGSIQACAFGVCLGIAASAGVTARAFEPLSVSADVDVEVDLPTPLPTLSADVELSWRNAERPDYADPFTSLRLVHPITAEEWEPATGEGDAPFVPLDSRPVVTFSHAVADLDGFGQPAAYVTDPAPETIGDDQVTYSLSEVALDYRPAGGGAFTPVDDLYGVWLLMGAAPADDPAEAEAGGERVTTKLEVWGRTPFSYEDHTTATTLSTPIVEDPAFPCGPDVQQELTCADWLEVPARTRYPLLFDRQGVEMLANRFTEVALEPSWASGTSFDRGLALTPGTVLIAALPGPCLRVATHVESLGTCTVQAWGRRDGAPTVLASRSVGSRTDGRLEFEVSGIEWLVYQAESRQDCGPWSWQLGDRSAAARAAAPRDRLVDPGQPAPPEAQGLPGGPGEPLPPGVPGGSGEPLPPGGAAAVVPDDANLPRPVTAVPCCTVLYQLCWTEEALAEAADRLEQRRESFREWTDAWAGSARVFGPNTTYRLTVTVQAAGIDAPVSFTRTVYFRTQGPPGFLASGDDGKGQLLADLGLYVDRTAPPAGAGRSLEAPPHYRDQDVMVLYNRDYLKALYAGKLFLQLLDANGTPVAGPDGGVLFEAVFTDPSHRVLTTGETVFVEAIDGADCSSVTTATVMPSDTQGFDPPTLAPSTLYQARLLGGWSQELGLDADGEVVVGDPAAIQLAEVLRWEFVTSRYETFSAHVGSYDAATGPWDGADAVAGAGGALDEAAVAALVDAVQASPPEWDEAEKAAADELLDLLGVRPRVPPERLDVTVVRARQRAVGLLLDSPEPLDWPRIAVAVSNAATGAALPHVLVRARDGRRALLFRTSNGRTLRSLGAADLAVAFTNDLAVAPARYSGGASGSETATLAVRIAEEAS